MFDKRHKRIGIFLKADKKNMVWVQLLLEKK